MISLILCGHGAFASGLEKAMLQLIGPQPQFIAIDFPESSTTAIFTAQCEAALAELEQKDGVVFLTDLLGGTPFRVAATLALQQPKWEVISGTNLQLIVEMALERNDALTTEQFRRQALACGRRGLTSLVDQLAAKQANGSLHQQPESGL